MRATNVRVEGIDRPLAFEVHDADDKHISASILGTSTWEPFETHVVTRLVRAGDLVVDAGANLGWYSVIAAALGADVVAFEPLPANAALLRTNVSINALDARVRVIECALGRRAGHARLALSSDNQGDHRIVADAAGAPVNRAIVEVDVRTLDDVLDETWPGRRPALIKLDTQGSEAAILAGGRRAWRPQPSGAEPTTLVLEFWPYGLARAGASVAELLGLVGELLPATHVAFEIQEWRRSLRPLTLDDLHGFAREGGYTEAAKGFTNVLVLPHERTGEIDDLVAS